MARSTHTVLAIWPTPCERCQTVIQMGGKFVVGRRNSHYCVPCWEADHE